MKHLEQELHSVEESLYQEFDRCQKVEEELVQKTNHMNEMISSFFISLPRGFGTSNKGESRK